jgi:PAS domain S-box-containing protein
VSALRTALRARNRQYELRDRLAIQALHAAIVASSDDAMIGKTTEGIILTWNKGAERMFGYTAEEAVGRSITLLIPPDRLDEERTILDRIARGERVDHFQTIRVTKDGRLLDISLTVSPIRDAANRIIGSSKVARDITAENRALQALREADRRKDEFLAILAHELRNPLAPIRNSLSLLEHVGMRDSVVEGVRTILDRQVRHLVRLVDDLMDVSRITRGQVELRRERTEMADVLHAAVEMSQPHLDAARLQLKVSGDPAGLVMIADPVRLTQMLSNLLNNAARYSDPGNEVWLTTRREGTEVVVSVRDFGIGIPPDMLHRIFDLFTQVAGADRSGRPGLGIGLTLVRGLAQLHGGTVSAFSEGLGKGSEFTLRLPLAVDAGPAEARETRVALGRLPLRILVVDDHRDAADSLAKLLKRSGADVEVAYDGLTALQVVERFHPVMVLLDLGMNGMDGYDVARRIRERTELDDVTLVAVTGWGQEEVRHRSTAAGFDHHLIKPVDVDELRALVPSVSRRQEEHATGSGGRSAT